MSYDDYMPYADDEYDDYDDYDDLCLMLSLLLHSI